MSKKIVSVLVLILIIAIGFSEKGILIHLLKQGGPIAVFISMLLVAISVFFPIVPFTVLAGMIGALFGTTKAVFISLTGAMAGTILFFFICRYGFKDWAQNMLKKYPKIQKYEEFLNKKAFLAILTARLIPVIPAPVFNSACGLSKVNWRVFFVASALGKIPNIVILSIAGANVTRNIWFSLGIYGSYLLVIFIISFIIAYRKISLGRGDHQIKKNRTGFKWDYFRK